MKILCLLSLALIANSALLGTTFAEGDLVPVDSVPADSVEKIVDSDSGDAAESNGAAVPFRAFGSYGRTSYVSISLRTSAEGLRAEAAAKIAKEIDFSVESVIEVSAGRRPSNGYGIRVTGVVLIENCYHVTVAFKVPAAGHGVGRVITNPTAAVVIPKAAAGATVKFVNPPKGYIRHSPVFKSVFDVATPYGAKPSTEWKARQDAE